MQKEDDVLESEFERFVAFGNLLDRRTRRYLVDYMRSRISQQPAPDSDLSDEYGRYFRRAIEDVFSIDHLLFVCSANTSVTRQIVLDTLYWMKKTFQKVEAKHPYAKELDYIKGWSVTPPKVFRYRYPQLLQFLRTEYAREELDTHFYTDRLDTFYRTEPDAWDEGQHRQFDRILTDLLAQWDALLQARILAYQLGKLDEAREDYLDRLEQKVSEYRQLTSILDPFTDYLGWDMSRDLWQATSFDVLKEYDTLLADEDSLKQLADLLGKMREAEIEIEEESFEKTIVRQEWTVDPLG
ncbi:MAG: hypothetical protein WA952_19800, partial [Lewinella sp.]